MSFRPFLVSNESNLYLFAFTDCLVAGNLYESRIPLSLINIFMITGEFFAQNNLFIDNSGVLFALLLSETTASSAYPRAMIENWNVQSGVGGISAQNGWKVITLSQSSFRNLTRPALSLIGSAVEMLHVTIQGVSDVGSLQNSGSFSLIELEDESSLMIESCLFTNIISAKSLIESKSSNLTASNTLFTGIGNTSSSPCITASFGYLSIKNCNFTSNIARQASGIFTVNMNSISLEDIVAHKNDAGTVGFAQLQSQVIMIKRSSFFGCSALKGSGALVIEGDATLEDLAFLENLSAAGPGALELQSGSLNVQNVQFWRNKGTKGTAFIFGQSLWDNVTFQANQVEFGGAVVVEETGSVFFEKSYFLENSATESSGAVLLSQEAEGTFIDCAFHNNSALTDAGAIFVANKALLQLKSCHFDNNQAGGSGGALYFSSLSKGNVSDTLISHNSGTSGGGGAFFTNLATPSFERVQFLGNNAVGGAGIRVTDNASPFFSHCFFKSNVALTSGGGSQSSGYSRPTFFFCTFSDNEAPLGSGGGALDEDFALSLYSGCTFETNQASTGGGTFSTAANGPIVFGTIFIGNIAKLYGGGFAVGKYSSSYMTDITCQNNTASGGGCCATVDSSSTLITNLIAFWNVASTQGGALLITDLSTPTISNGSFIANSSPTGGALAATESSQGIVDDSRFMHNNASDKGGAIFSKGFGITIRGSIIEDNLDRKSVV